MKSKKKNKKARNNYQNRVKNRAKKQVNRNTTPEKVKQYYTAYYSLLVGRFLFLNKIPLKELSTVKQIVLTASKYCNAPYNKNSLEFLENFVNTNGIQPVIEHADSFLSISHTSQNLIDNFSKFKRYIVK